MFQEWGTCSILLVAALLFGMADSVRAGDITLDNFKFVECPGFRDGLVAYGSLGYSKKS